MRANGLAFWLPIRKVLEPYDGTADKWSPILVTHRYRALKERAMSLAEYDSNGRIIELHHFLIQCVRIPMTEPMTLRKLMHVALNIGQLVGMLDAMYIVDHDFLNLMKSFFELKMHMLSTYVSDPAVYDGLITPSLLEKVRTITS
jgi:hypothetical protein